MSMDDFEIMDEDAKQLIKNAIPTEKNNDDFVAEIHKNVVNSGIFLAATRLKEERARKSKRTAAENAGYVKVERKGTTVDVDVVGNYLDIKSFIDKVDVQNRLTVPNEIMISRMEENVQVAEGEEAPEINELVKAKVNFTIYDKDVNTNVSISKLSSMNDEIVKSLLTTGLKKGVVEQYKNSITSTLFKPVTASGSGKEDLFAK